MHLNQILLCSFHKFIDKFNVHGSIGVLQSWYLAYWWASNCFFHKLSYEKSGPYFFVVIFLCHLSYHQQFVWYPGYNGYQFYAALVLSMAILQYDMGSLERWRNVKASPNSLLWIQTTNCQTYVKNPFWMSSTKSLIHKSVKVVEKCQKLIFWNVVLAWHVSEGTNCKKEYFLHDCILQQFVYGTDSFKGKTIRRDSPANNFLLHGTISLVFKKYKLGLSWAELSSNCNWNFDGSSWLTSD